MKHFLEEIRKLVPEGCLQDLQLTFARRMARFRFWQDACTLASSCLEKLRKRYYSRLSFRDGMVYGRALMVLYESVKKEAKGKYAQEYFELMQDVLSHYPLPQCRIHYAESMCLSHGENRNIVASKAPMYENGRIVGLVGSFEDVTNDVRQKKEIEELNRKLDAALKAERKASQAKTDFLARMSHDMRTPLTTVMGLCDIAFEHYQDEEILSYFRNIKSSSHYLLSILTDILDMAAICRTVSLTDSFFRPSMPSWLMVTPSGLIIGMK